MQGNQRGTPVLRLLSARGRGGDTSLIKVNWSARQTKGRPRRARRRARVKTNGNGGSWPSQRTLGNEGGAKGCAHRNSGGRQGIDLSTINQKGRPGRWLTSSEKKLRGTGVNTEKNGEKTRPAPEK